MQNVGVVNDHFHGCFRAADTTARWDGYLEFQRRPQRMLEWFHTHMN